MADDKTSPGYYKKGGMECRDAIKAATSNLTGEEAYNVGCAIKYLWRFKEKNGAEDLKKARQYIDFLINAEKPAVSQATSSAAQNNWSPHGRLGDDRLGDGGR